MCDGFGIDGDAIGMVHMILEDQWKMRSDAIAAMARLKRAVDMDEIDSGDEDETRRAVAGVAGIVLEGADTSDIDKMIEVTTEEMLGKIRKGKRFI